MLKYLKLITNLNIPFSNHVKMIQLINEIIDENKKLYEQLPLKLQTTIGYDIYSIKPFKYNHMDSFVLKQAFEPDRFMKEMNELNIILKNLLLTYIGLLVHHKRINEKEQQKLQLNIVYMQVLPQVTQQVTNRLMQLINNLVPRVKGGKNIFEQHKGKITVIAALVAAFHAQGGTRQQLIQLAGPNPKTVRLTNTSGLTNISQSARVQGPLAQGPLAQPQLQPLPEVPAIEPQVQPQGNAQVQIEDLNRLIADADEPDTEFFDAFETPEEITGITPPLIGVTNPEQISNISRGLTAFKNTLSSYVPKVLALPQTATNVLGNLTSGLDNLTSGLGIDTNLANNLGTAALAYAGTQLIPQLANSAIEMFVTNPNMFVGMGANTTEPLQLKGGSNNMSSDSYYIKYLKYKQKYLNLKNN